MTERGDPLGSSPDPAAGQHDEGLARGETTEFTRSAGGHQAPPQSFSLQVGSDAEIAEKVTADLQERLGQIVFCGQFWFYGQTHWEAIPRETLWLAASRYDGALYKSISGALSQVKLNKARIESILACMRPALTSEAFFDNPITGINCASGFIRFDDRGNPRLEPHHPDHRCRHTLPGRWPTAISENHRETSLLRKLLDGCFDGDSDKQAKIDLLAEVAGVAALGIATKLIKPNALVLKGELAENGKSQVLDVLRSLLPKSAIASISPTQFDDRTFTCHLEGKLLNAPDELASGEAIASEVFKKIITGEPLTVRDLYKSAFEFRPIAQHVFATNNLPPFKGGMDRGVRRRLLVLCFNRVIPLAERIEHIGLRIGAEEADLLLDWAVRGASRVIPTRAFTEPPSSTEALREWMLSSDPVLGWLDSDAVRFAKPGWNLEVRTKIAYNCFRQWAIDEGYPHDKLPAVNGFSQRVVAGAADKGVSKKRTSEGALFVGLACTGLGASYYGR